MSKTNLPAAATQSFELIKIANHFAGAGKMVDLGSGSQRQVEDYSSPPAQIRTCGTTAYGTCLDPVREIPW